MAIISQNGVKHSLLSCQTVISGKKQAESECYLKKQSQFPDERMNVNSCYTNYYDDCAALGLRKNKANQSQSQDAGSDVERIPAALFRGDKFIPAKAGAGMTNVESLRGRGILRLFAKQSQFPGAKMSLTSRPISDYDDFSALRLRKNKAKQSQFQTGQLRTDQQKAILRSHRNLALSGLDLTRLRTRLAGRHLRSIMTLVEKLRRTGILRCQSRNLITEACYETSIALYA
jgi:hypothetical protein